mmetsp:Transcript_14010/g.33985  ORF Transcript_14010/g.33985 Transcript_14010/m.33985 type:complete len:86 (-) Transcript_14010:570-827(-)
MSLSLATLGLLCEELRRGALRRPPLRRVAQQEHLKAVLVPKRETRWQSSYGGSAVTSSAGIGGVASKRLALFCATISTSAFVVTH